MNPICLMMSLTMMGVTLGLLARALFLFPLMNNFSVLANMLVMPVSWGWELFYQQELSQLLTLFCWMRSYQKESGLKVGDS